MLRNVKRVTVDVATSKILEASCDYGIESVALRDSVGRVLAEVVTADRDFPPFNRVCMDGICIRKADFENGIRTYSLVGTIGAGQESELVITEGQAIEIMTGAVLPISADCVIRYEDLEIKGNSVTITTDVLPGGLNVHPKGIDNHRGAVLIHKHTIIRPAEINILATVGNDSVRVFKRPKVLIVSTGNEIVDVDITPLPHQIRRSNSYGIESIISEWASEITLLHVSDKEEEIEAQLTHQLVDTDILILSGGVSMGKYDFIPDVLDRLGAVKQFHGVLQKPGKPFWFGTLGDKRIFALPGNPVSSMVCTLRYIVPYLRNSFGLNPIVYHSAILSEDVKFKPALQRFMEVSVETNKLGNLIASPVSSNGSGDFTKLLSSNALVEIDSKDEVVLKNQVVRIIYT